MKTPSSLCKVFIGGISHFYNSNRNSPIDIIHYTNTITQQQMIGWNDFARGWVHHSLTAITIEQYGKECKNTHQFTGIE